MSTVRKSFSELKYLPLAVAHSREREECTKRAHTQWYLSNKPTSASKTYPYEINSPLTSWLHLIQFKNKKETKCIIWKEFWKANSHKNTWTFLVWLFPLLRALPTILKTENQCGQCTAKICFKILRKTGSYC